MRAILNAVRIFTCLALAISMFACASQSSDQNDNNQSGVEENSNESANSGVGKVTDNTTPSAGSGNSESKNSETKRVSIGDIVQDDNYEICLTSVEWKDEIYPPDTSGYYRYYKDEDGKTYLLIKGTYKNLGTVSTQPNWATKSKIVLNNKYNVDTQIEGIQNGSMSSSYAIGPMETSDIYIWASVSDEMKDSSDVSLIWYIPKGNLDRYYSAGGSHDTYEVKLI